MNIAQELYREFRSEYPEYTDAGLKIADEYDEK